MEARRLTSQMLTIAPSALSPVHIFTPFRIFILIFSTHLHSGFWVLSVALSIRNSPCVSCFMFHVSYLVHLKVFDLLILLEEDPFLRTSLIDLYMILSILVSSTCSQSTLRMRDKICSLSKLQTSILYFYTFFFLSDWHDSREPPWVYFRHYTMRVDYNPSQLISS